MMKFSLQLVPQPWKKKSNASCKRHMIRCNLRLQIAMFQKSLQPLQNVEPSSITSITRSNFLCNLCFNSMARQVAVRLQRVTCPLCDLSRNCSGLQRLHTAELGSTFCNDCIDCFKIIASCSLKLQHVTCFLHLVMDFFSQRCDTRCKKNSTV